MLIERLAHTLEKCQELEGFWSKIDAGEDATLAVASSARPFLVSAAFERNPRCTLVVLPGEKSADSFIRLASAYLGDERVLRLPVPDANPFNLEAADTPGVNARRAEALWALQTARPVMVVASARALLRRMPPPGLKQARPLCLVSGMDLSTNEDAQDGMWVPTSFDDVAAELVRMGYENVDGLEGRGTFCVRGGAIDVFPANLPHPVRIDFFGDEIDDIRRFLPATGQTIAPLDSVEIYPIYQFETNHSQRVAAAHKLRTPALSNAGLRELLVRLEDDSRPAPAAALPYLFDTTAGIADYIHPSALTVLIEPRSLFDDALHFNDELAKLADGTSLIPEDLYFSAAQMDFGANQRATYVSIMRAGIAPDAELVVKRVDVAGNPEKIFGRMRSLIEGNYAVVFSVPNFRARQEMKLELVDRGMPISEQLDVMEETQGKPAARKSGGVKRGVVNIVDVDIPLGMIFPAAKLALIALGDSQGAAGAGTARTRRIDVTEITFPYKPGDYVVHAMHGVALFSDIVTQEIGGVERDYLLLEYAEGDKLYVPVEQLDRVTRYVGPEGSKPRLTRLNTADWSRAMRSARKATEKLAFDLVDVYARRAASKGYRYHEDTPWQRQMEDAFPYTETPDQMRAIADVKADMQSERPMDRLICGDVGFGKTEVALRAAFKATQDHKQVMVLCPTTILAQQHFTTFSERFKPFGVHVEVLSRFRTAAQQREALQGFADGKVEVLIGTHRLLSNDVNPRDLGLVIIDEEQRFGVGHKEQLKNLRESVDVLTLSATPIPRTMQMGISGVRDMSVILTPPDDRRPVKVHVGEWDPDIVSDAIRLEMQRGGQVYYVSNRVRSIEDAVARVNEAAGEARVGVAHGQMKRDELERVMEDFSAGELDVLVATTIIESGIDNPHTNTLIIEDSQRLGLAQMYQLKGRVGRSSTQAYAYFLFPGRIPLTEDALARLTAINENAELGSGMRVAMADLEIRGAGTILGAEQSGNMSKVGFDLFAQMLAQAVNLTRTGTEIGDDYLPPALSDIVVNVPERTLIPEDYVPDTDERVLWYRKIASAESIEVVDEIQRDLADKHPEMPAPTLAQFEKARLKAFANARGIRSISVAGGRVVVEPVRLSRAQASKLRKVGGRYLADRGRIHIPVRVLPEDESLLLSIRMYLADFLASPAKGAE